MISKTRWFVSLAAFISTFTTATALAEVKTQTIAYSDGDVSLTGHLAWDDAVPGKRPGVLVIHEWWGLNAHAKERAERLAEAGYVAFAVDMYGEGKVTIKADQARTWMTAVTSNPQAWLRRADAGLDILKSHEKVDSTSLGAIGFCFGGTTVMQMAYAGVELDAVASFHGSLPAAPDSVTSITPRVFAAHGRDDDFVPKKNVAAFQDGLDRIGATWDLAVYSGTRHSFTNPDASQYGIPNVAYNARADNASWNALMRVFDDAF